MSNLSTGELQREGCSRNEDFKRVHIAARPLRRQVTHQVYTRLSGSIPSNYYDSASAPFVWEQSDDSSSAPDPEPSDSLSQKQTDDRIEEWMERMNVHGQEAGTEHTKETTYATVGTYPFAVGVVDPDTLAPSIVGSHFSDDSLPSRPTSPVHPPPVMQRHPGQEPVVLLPPGYVPPERRAERERANQIIVSESSERRRRRREERDRDRQRYD
ncbi:uncharacterized protein GGS22DRAFT_1532 [Annulohypoxylon maeteangense]|uniref:uncharacterized protein n=1 Tax=Annulohypoxylon maeteangense TaxID=1927788 RepID=UPI002007C113|nr:uncharacterized protein GGS22DRAFT_1532 [Annulohypoxylon maeteangense]KAI0889588.1 hypothetical protein GGS22DRAFT_1532 [Annulohypoxylon maeteangense]